MTQVETSDIYYIELDAEADTYTGCVMIFEENGQIKQSDDLLFASANLTAGKTYTLTMQTNWIQKGDIWVFVLDITEKI